MRQAEFESLLFLDVQERAAAERTPPKGKPKYHGRPWAQLRDQMLARGARSVGELPGSAIAVFYRSTGSVDRGVMGVLKELFG